MTVELALILGFLFHLVGDYLLQNDWMANEKTKNFLPAFLHATIYSIPFMFLVSWEAWLVIYVTHFFIDRYRLATYWIQAINSTPNRSNFGYGKDKPMFVSMWLMIIIDNTFHILINSACILVDVG